MLVVHQWPSYFFECRAKGSRMMRLLVVADIDITSFLSTPVWARLRYIYDGPAAAQPESQFDLKP